MCLVLFFHTGSRERGGCGSGANDYHCSYKLQSNLLSKCLPILCKPIGQYPETSKVLDNFDQFNKYLSRRRFCRDCVNFFSKPEIKTMATGD